MTCSVECRRRLRIVSLISRDMDAVWRYEASQDPRTDVSRLCHEPRRGTGRTRCRRRRQQVRQVNKIALPLLKEEINKPLRKLEDYLNEMPGILGAFDLEESPDYTSFSVWDDEFPMKELRRLLRASAEQAGFSGTASIDASGFQRDQASSHYRNRVGTRSTR